MKPFCTFPHLREKTARRADPVNCRVGAGGVVLMTAKRTKEFLTDFRDGMRQEELMRKYNLSRDKLEEICHLLRRSDLTALRKLWEKEKLSDTQFMRAFSEVESNLNGEE